MQNSAKKLSPTLTEKALDGLSSIQLPEGAEAVAIFGPFLLAVPEGTPLLLVRCLQYAGCEGMLDEDDEQLFEVAREFGIEYLHEYVQDDDEEWVLINLADTAKHPAPITLNSPTVVRWGINGIVGITEITTRREALEFWADGRTSLEPMRYSVVDKVWRRIPIHPAYAAIRGAWDSSWA